MDNLLQTKDILIELGTEEMPAKGLEPLAKAFAENIAARLSKASLPFSQIKEFVTPRRLAVVISDVAPYQADRLLTKRGPSKQLAFDDQKKPTAIALKFAESCGVTVQDLTLEETAKGAWLVYEHKESGQKTESLIPQIIQETLDNLPLPKRMRWGDGRYEFIRPVHWVCLMIGSEVIPAQYFGCVAEPFTHGHRFHHPDKIHLKDPQLYEDVLLNSGQVIADFTKRKNSIAQQISELCLEKDFHLLMDENLLTEVTGLNEWPVVLLGKFSKDYLSLPPEVLISSMKFHQKCFSIVDAKQQLLPYFIIVSNIESKDPNCVIHGNECVMEARLADAVFYFSKDKEISLQTRGADLKHVIFQHGLGNLFEKSERIEKIGDLISESIHANKEQVKRASQLCKADLLTHMVSEFPELQGVMGKYYALHDKESEAVALAIQQQYNPKTAQDTLPSSKESATLAMSDRIDTLVGLFGLGKRPSGDKDPFALRRTAFTLLLILIEKGYSLDLEHLFKKSKEFYKDYLKSDAFIPELMDFCFERLRAWYQEKNISTRVFDAVYALKPTDPYDFHKRILAVNAFRNLPQAESLAQANKRVHNILSKANLNLDTIADLNESAFQEEAEKALFTALSSTEKQVQPLLNDKSYEQALIILANLKNPIDLFFDKVMVMVEDPKLRENRLKLLKKLTTLFLEVADISVL